MKKYFYLLAIALVSMTFCSCGGDDDDNNNDGPKPIVDPVEFSFVAPYMEWGSSLDDVRTFMKRNLPDLMEDGEAYTSSEGTGYLFHDKSAKIQYSYTIKDGKLVNSGINYMGMNDKFNDLKSQVSTKLNISDWDEKPEMAGVKWWSGRNSEKKISVSIGYGSNGIIGGYMYVEFQEALY